MKSVARVVVNVGVLMAFFIAGFIASCAMYPTDTALAPYIASFERDMGYKKDTFKDYNMSFRNLPVNKKGKTILSQCNLVTSRVTINPEYWYRWRTSQLRRKGIVYHEMVHCVCKIMHINDLLPDKCAVSLMHKYLPNDKCLERHWKRYIKDLKNRCGG